MAHNLFGERFLGVREPAWHRLGIVIPDPIPLPEAIEVARANFGIIKAPLSADLGNGLLVGTEMVGLIREPTADDDQYRYLGEAKNGYTFLQNVEIAELFNPLTERWPVETVGCLGMGETIFIVLDAGEMETAGDVVHCYFTIHDTRDGRTAMGINFTPVRTVCQNTLEAGKAAAVASAELRHTISIDDEVKWRVALLREMQDVSSKVMQSFERMTKAQLTTDAITNILTYAYPYPRKPLKVAMLESLNDKEIQLFNGLLESANYSNQLWENAKARMDERRGLVEELFGKFNDENPKTANTPWALYNAVVEFEDYREPQGKETPEDADYAVLFGERAKTKARAYEKAIDVTDKSTKIYTKNSATVKVR